MKPIFYLIALALCLSCASNKKYRLSTKTLDKSFSGSFSELAANDSTSFVYNDHVSRIFNLDNPTRSGLRFSFDESGHLKISCTNALGGENFVTYNGRSKKRYYEIFLEKKRIPFAPVYSITRVNRIRLRIGDDGKLIIDHYQNDSGMILLMAAGHSSRNQYVLNKSR